ncbi:MAG TPA: amidohydrolase family protein [Acidimicrobiales bacterium]|nr:amidohydrolase family protein [Acidimicrobiales bacterium]
MTEPNTQLDYGLFDADNHYYEPYDCFTRHIEPAFKDQAVRVEVGEDGLGRTYIGDHTTLFTPVMMCDSIGPPGSFKGMVCDDTADSEIPTISPRVSWPAYMNRDARVRLMDDQGVEAAIFLPTAAVCLEYDLYKMGPAAAFANLRSFNRWVEEDWGFSYQDRIFAVPMLSLADIDLAVAEVERVLALGARFVHLNPGPAYGRSPADPHFDPFWARVAEAGVPVIYHIGDSGYNELVGANWGQPVEANLFEHTPLQNYLGLCDRPIQDTMAALVLGNLFTRFPTLKVLSVENGCRWVRPLLTDMDHAARMARSRGLTGIPSEIFREHVYVAPFWEDDAHDLVGLIGAEHVLLGSDFPHPEGEANPIDYLNALRGMDEATVRLIMRDNAARLAGYQPSAATAAA